jgi:hypothetical protein
MAATVKLLRAGAAFIVGGAALAAAANLTKPAFPATKTLDLVEVDVVARATLDAGKPTAAEVVYNQNGDPFGEAARTALAASSFEGGGDVYVWYHYRMGQDTLTAVLPPEDAQNLDAEPTLTETVAPTFPPGAPSLSTAIDLRILVGTNGAVWYARAADPQANALYVERATAAALKYKFQPATRGGATVPAWYTCVIDFR